MKNGTFLYPAYTPSLALVQVKYHSMLTDARVRPAILMPEIDRLSILHERPKALTKPIYCLARREAKVDDHVPLCLSRRRERRPEIWLNVARRRVRRLIRTPRVQSIRDCSSVGWSVGLN